MAYTDPSRDRVVETFAFTEDKDRIRWGPILAGLMVAIASQLVLSALGAAIGLSAGASGTDAGSVGVGVGIWAIISLLISLFLGSWVATSGASPMNKKTAMLHGLILWATTLALSAWLLASGVSGAFGVAASNAGEVINQVQTGRVDVPNQAPNVTDNDLQQVAGNSAKAAWSFLIGSLLGLASSLAGASAGAKNPKLRAGRVTDVQSPENFVR